MSAVIKFFLVTFSFSWLFWLPAVVSGKDVTASWWGVAWLLGGFGPTIVAAVLSARTKGSFSMRQLWRRTVDFSRISGGWYLFALLIFPLIAASAAGIVALFGWQQASFQGLKLTLANPISLIGLIVLGLIAGPIAEELGWRGYALEHLQAEYSPPKSTWILALIWWAWHIPLFFMEGTTQAGWGFFTIDSVFFLVTIFPLSFIMTWAYNHTNRSVLSAILLHFGFNFTLGFVLPASVAFDLVRIILMSIVAWALVHFTSPLANTPVPDVEMG